MLKMSSESQTNLTLYALFLDVLNRGSRFAAIRVPWKLKPGFINRVLVAVIFEASKCL